VRLARDDDPLIDGYFDHGASEGHLGLATGKPRGEDRANVRPQVRVRQNLAERGLRRKVKIYDRCVEGRFPFAAFKTGAFLLHSLDELAADFPQPQNEARFLERAIGRVEIG